MLGKAQQVLGFLDRSFEPGGLGCLERLGSQVSNLRRICLRVVDPELIVEMRSGRQSCLANIADRLTLLDFGSFACADAKPLR